MEELTAARPLNWERRMKQMEERAKNPSKERGVMPPPSIRHDDKRDQSRQENKQRIRKEFLGTADDFGMTLESPRPACRRCAMKHLGQAAALFQEALQGYPAHRWLAIGHMAEAEAEIQAESSEFADGLRIERKKAEEGGYIPPIIALITELDSWGPCESCGQMAAAIEEVQKEAKDVSGEPVVVEVPEDFGSLVADLQALAVELME